MKPREWRYTIADIADATGRTVAAVRVDARSRFNPSVLSSVAKYISAYKQLSEAAGLVETCESDKDSAT